MSQPPFPDPHSFWHAHPFYARSARFAHYSRRGRFFPRVFWFALGAGAYAWWSSHKEHRQRAIEGYSGGQEGSTGQNGYNHHGSWGWGCQRKNREVEERRSAERPADVRYDKQTTRAWESDSQLPVPTPLTTSAAVVPPAYAPSTAPVEQQKETRQLPSDHFREVGRQASDAFADISESALDTLLENVQALKKRLAETREAREHAHVEHRLPVDHEQMRK